MGRIKSTLVKRTSNNLLKEDNKFNGTFDRNKKLLADTMPSKKVRNKIAGYIARLKRRETQEK
jgi:ribosomal protein S17E